MSPSRSRNSLYTMSRSASRIRCTITCLAVWAAIRPKSFGVTSTSTVSPTWISGSHPRASASGISAFASLTDSTIVRTLKTCCSPVSRSSSTRMFWAADPKFFLYAERRAASIASMRTSLPSPFSSSSCLMALMSSALFTDHSPPSPRALRRAFGSLQIFAQIRHLHHEPGLGDRLVVQTDFPPVVQSDRHPAVHQPEQAPPEPPLPLLGLVRRDGDRPPRKPHEVGQTAQRPVESRRRHLQRIGLHRQIVQVQFPAQRFAEPGAVADTRAAVPIHEHPQDLAASRADQLHVHDLQAHPRRDRPGKVRRLPGNLVAPHAIPLHKRAPQPSAPPRNERVGRAPTPLESVKIGARV